MALTDYQRKICHILASERMLLGDRYVAGGAALNELLQSPRLSHDVDVFHDTREAVQQSWDADRKRLVKEGYDVQIIREFPTFVEAEIHMGSEGLILQWVQDSAFRFFPLIEHPDFGMTLHPFDLATNKTLALVGRAEVRDWVDTIHCHNTLQPFGYLVWATCGKDPGLSPEFILEQASRSAHYSQKEYETLAFADYSPNIIELTKAWRAMLTGANILISHLPEDHIGCCVLNRDGSLYKGSATELVDAIQSDSVLFHIGSVCGAWPRIIL